MLEEFAYTCPVPALFCAGVSEDDVLNAVRTNMTCASDRRRYYAWQQAARSKTKTAMRELELPTRKMFYRFRIRS